MPGVLDFTRKPGEASEDGIAKAVYRGDTFTHVFTFNEGATPWEVEGTLTAHVRTRFLNGTDTVATPLATFEVTQSIPGTVVITLTPEQTLDLPAAWVWDLQQDDGGTITTLMRGKGKTVDDATR